jgi:WD40 repeat protein
MYRKLLWIALLFAGSACYAQREDYTWYFGNGAGLDFNTDCSPTVLTDGKIDGFEGCASISDPVTGQLLFYTNSDSVWNRNHVVMPNGHLVNNGSTITQVLILAHPGSATNYFIITAEVQGFSGQHLRVHEVDMSLNSGLGGFVYKDSVIYNAPVAEKVTAVRHVNGIDVWLIAHGYNSANYIAFLITQAGINPIPVISTIGKIHYDQSYADAIGEIKVSPDGQKLAAVTLVHPDIELFDFNNATGQVSNPIVLPETGGYDGLGNPCGLYGVSFSANSAMLYVSQWLLPSSNVSGKIIQYDISSNDSIGINATRMNVFTNTTHSLYSLKLAPDRKIYVGRNASGYIGVINAPDIPGMACNYVDNGIFLNGRTSSWGLNNLMEYGNYCEALAVPTTAATPQVVISPNPARESVTFTFANPRNENHWLELYNISGELVFEGNTTTGTTISADIHTLPRGMYYYRLKSMSGNCINGKLIAAA